MVDGGHREVIGILFVAPSTEEVYQGFLLCSLQQGSLEAPTPFGHTQPGPYYFQLRELSCWFMGPVLWSGWTGLMNPWKLNIIHK